MGMQLYKVFLVWYKMSKNLEADGIFLYESNFSYIMKVPHSISLHWACLCLLQDNTNVLN
jgi:hypothetical protein